MMDDLISRAAALDAYADLYWMDERMLNFKKEIDTVYDKIRNLASAQPERKTGWWIYDDNDWSSVSGECSVCGWKAHVCEDDVVGMDYCPNCGAKMRKDGE